MTEICECGKEKGKHTGTRLFCDRLNVKNESKTFKPKTEFKLSDKIEMAYGDIKAIRVVHIRKFIKKLKEIVDIREWKAINKLTGDLTTELKGGLK